MNYPKEDFIKSPKEGQVIKVFTERDKYLCYGIAQGTKYKLRNRVVEIPNSITNECKDKINNLRKEIRKNVKLITPKDSTADEIDSILKKYHTTKECKSILSEIEKLNEIKQSNRETKKEDFLREVVVVKISDDTFHINDVNFFLDKSKVELIK